MPSPTLTRRALLAGTGTAIASAALAGPYVAAAGIAEPIATQSLDGRLKSAVGYVRHILSDMGCEEYVLVMREEKAGVPPALLEFEPGTGALKRQTDLA